MAQGLMPETLAIPSRSALRLANAVHPLRCGRDAHNVMFVAHFLPSDLSVVDKTVRWQGHQRRPQGRA
jgi:hypothetical protein